MDCVRERHRTGRLGAGSLAGVAFVAMVGACAPAPDGPAANPADTAVGAAPNANAASNVAVASRPSGEAGTFGFGSPASESLIAAWDIDIAPNGAGLPPGSGTVREGLELYRVRCQACHGVTGNEGPNDLLTGRIPGDEFPFATDRTYRSTVGNYWPYATTMFDYTRRAMPFDMPGTLTDDEVYALVGAMLYFNDLLPEDAVVDSAVVVDTHMPARDRFVYDDRTGGPAIR